MSSETSSTPAVPGRVGRYAIRRMLPLGSAPGTASMIVLSCMHLIVAAVLTPGLRRTARGR